MKIMQIDDNQQLLKLSNEQKQVFLSGRFGDGCIATSNSGSTYFTTNCKFEEYLKFKKSLLGNMSKDISLCKENGYAKTPIYNLRSCSSNILKYIKEMPLEEVISNLDDLGIALWFYDDGSLHKTGLFYNLNTQSLTKEFQEDVVIPFFNKRNIFPKLQIENKKDGRIFWYLRIPKYDGSCEISKILNKFPVSCYNYKLWSSETIQKWSKLQEELKSQGKSPSDFCPYSLGCMMKKIIL